jgi:hypothetical protein
MYRRAAETEYIDKEITVRLSIPGDGKKHEVVSGKTTKTKTIYWYTRTFFHHCPCCDRILVSPSNGFNFGLSKIPGRPSLSSARQRRLVRTRKVMGNGSKSTRSLLLLLSVSLSSLSSTGSEAELMIWSCIDFVEMRFFFSVSSSLCRLVTGMASFKDGRWILSPAMDSMDCSVAKIFFFFSSRDISRTSTDHSSSSAGELFRMLWLRADDLLLLVVVFVVVALDDDDDDDFSSRVRSNQAASSCRHCDCKASSCASRRLRSCNPKSSKARAISTRLSVPVLSSTSSGLTTSCRPQALESHEQLPHRYTNNVLLSVTTATPQMH